MPFDLTRWTIRLALMVYVAALALRVKSSGIQCRGEDKERGRGGEKEEAAEVRRGAPCLSVSPSPCLDEPQTDSLARALWSCACVLTWMHVLCAFAFHHQWSHAEAYDHTARETASKVGIDWGGGIWFNYLFLALWAADAIWWWWKPVGYRSRAKWLAVGVHAYLAFIAINATVVFESGPVRYAGLAAIAGLVVLWIARPQCHSPSLTRRASTRR